MFVCRKKLEPDKLGSIWLIKRFVDKNATFRFVENDVPLTNGVPLDEPEGELRRYANNSCFETVAIRFKIQDPGIQRFGRVMRDIELNYWAEKHYPQSLPLAQEIRAIVSQHPDNPEACVEKSLPVFDRVLAELSRQAPDTDQTGRKP